MKSAHLACPQRRGGRPGWRAVRAGQYGKAAGGEGSGGVPAIDAEIDHGFGHGPFISTEGLSGFLAGL